MRVEEAVGAAMRHMHEVMPQLQSLQHHLQTSTRPRSHPLRRDIRAVRAALLHAASLLAEDDEESQTQVRVAPPSPHIGLHGGQLGGERCGVSVARLRTSTLTA